MAPGVVRDERIGALPRLADRFADLPPRAGPQFPQRREDGDGQRPQVLRPALRPGVGPVHPAATSASLATPHSRQVARIAFRSVSRLRRPRRRGAAAAPLRGDLRPAEADDLGDRRVGQPLGGKPRQGPPQAFGAGDVDRVGDAEALREPVDRVERGGPAPRRGSRRALCRTAPDRPPLRRGPLAAEPGLIPSFLGACFTADGRRPSPSAIHAVLRPWLSSRRNASSCGSHGPEVVGRLPPVLRPAKLPERPQLPVAVGLDEPVRGVRSGSGSRSTGPAPPPGRSPRPARPGLTSPRRRA